MIKKNIVIPIFLLIVVFIVSLGCGSSNEGTLITPSTQEDQQTEVEEQEQLRL
jgi:hypothetical protein